MVQSILFLLLSLLVVGSINGFPHTDVRQITNGQMIINSNYARIAVPWLENACVSDPSFAVHWLRFCVVSGAPIWVQTELGSPLLTLSYNGQCGGLVVSSMQQIGLQLAAQEGVVTSELFCVTSEITDAYGVHANPLQISQNTKNTDKTQHNVNTEFVVAIVPQYQENGVLLVDGIEQESSKITVDVVLDGVDSVLFILYDKARRTGKMKSVSLLSQTKPLNMELVLIMLPPIKIMYVQDIRITPPPMIKNDGDADSGQYFVEYLAVDYFSGLVADFASVPIERHSTTRQQHPVSLNYYIHDFAKPHLQVKLFKELSNEFIFRSWEDSLEG